MFRVKFFRRGEDGKFLWPGFSQNARVLAWIVDRSHGRKPALESPLGWMPHFEDVAWHGLEFPESIFREVMSVDRGAALGELDQHERWLNGLSDRLPPELESERDRLRERLERAPEHWQPPRPLPKLDQTG